MGLIPPLLTPHLGAPRSGVPPDAFSATGQLWGSPLYDWKAHAAEGFAWWRQRIARSMQVRLAPRPAHAPRAAAPAAGAPAHTRR